MMQKKANPQWLPKLRGECDLSTNQERLSFKLLQREETNAKKSRVEYVLLQQYISKYGSKAPNSKINTYIKNAIKNLLLESEDAEVSEKMLESLEADIRDISEKIKSDILTQTLASSKPAVGSINHSMTSSLSNSGNNSRARTARESKEDPSHEVDPNQWSVVSAILAIGDEEQKIKEYQTLLSRKNNFKHG